MEKFPAVAAAAVTPVNKKMYIPDKSANIMYDGITTVIGIIFPISIPRR